MSHGVQVSQILMDLVVGHKDLTFCFLDNVFDGVILNDLAVLKMEMRVLLNARRTEREIAVSMFAKIRDLVARMLRTIIILIVYDGLLKLVVANLFYVFFIFQDFLNVNIFHDIRL